MSQPITDPSRAHAAATVALIEAGVPAGYRVYLGGVADDEADITYPYLVVWPPPASRTPVNLTKSVSVLTTVLQVTAVGHDRDEVLAALDRVADALQGRRPVMDGRKAGLFEQVGDTSPVTEDNKIRSPQGTPVVSGAVLFAVQSVPAPA
jgi:hypothetical protein